MKRNVFIIIVMVAILGCTKDSVADKSNAIIFEITHPVSTKATATSFEGNDSISLFAVEYNGDSPNVLQIGGNYLNNEKLTFDGSNWSGEQKLFWSSVSCDFYGIYPYQQIFNSIESFSYDLALDQNGSGFGESDLMFAKATNVKQTDGSVSLHFNHLLSKLVINLVKGDNFEGDIPGDVTTHIYNTVTSCFIDWTTGSVKKSSLSVKKTITMNRLSNTRFEAIVIPQNIEKKTPLIEITMGGIAYLLECSLSLRTGCVHTINVTLNTSPDQEMIEISIDPSQGGWN